MLCKTNPRRKMTLRAKNQIRMKMTLCKKKILAKKTNNLGEIRFGWDLTRMGFDRGGNDPDED